MKISGGGSASLVESRLPSRSFPTSTIAFPSPYGFYPNHPQQGFRQGQFQFHGQQQFQNSNFNNQEFIPRQNSQQGQRARASTPPKLREGVEKVVENPGEVKGEKNARVEPGKVANVTCFNCAAWGHFSTYCKKPKLCFICYTADHVGCDCSEWSKSMESAQYLGSAAQGLSFFHVEVTEEKNRSGYMKFLDNCAVFDC
jgi:hypothetical protein